MVDLVKIRKKAKEKAAAAAAALADAVSEVSAEVAGRGSKVAEAGAKAPEEIHRTTSAPASKKKQKTAEPAAKDASADAQPAFQAPEPKTPTDNRQPTTDDLSTDNRQPTTDNRPTDNRERDNRQLTSKLERFLQTAGERRVERGQEAEVTAEEQLELLTFAVAGELYAVSIDNVVEIVTPRAVTRIPNSDPLVVGILSLRGMIVTLVDARRRLGHPEGGEATAEARVIVVQLDHETLGFSVDKVLRVVKIGATAVEPHPVVHASEQDDSVRGVFRHSDALTILLDLDKLLKPRAAASA